MLICVDQFEELFGRPVDDGAAFAGALGACLTEPRPAAPAPPD
ncbi:hypothetical protein OHU34_26470 [Streptomyces sp. NBC_00080]|nr:MULTISPECIES: hypothetical protein [Streptomyces]TQJ53288.1 hypothetical protein FBY34_1010 [Streptomyces sp. SLBN-115]